MFAKSLACLIGFAFILGSLIANANDTVVVQWNTVSVGGIEAQPPGLGPPMAARALAVIDTCMYNAWTAYSEIASPTLDAGIAKRPRSERTDENKNKAISFAAYRAILNLFPGQTAAAQALMSTLGYDAMDTSSDATTPSGIGNIACAAEIAYRQNDGANQYGLLGPTGKPYSDYTGFVPVNTPDAIYDPNAWQPLCTPSATPRPCPASNTQKYVGAFWGMVTPFNPATKIPPTPGPALYPSEDYIEGVNRILKYSADLTDRTKAIAEYWADFPGTYLPPGHWAAFAQFVSQRDNHNVDQDVKMFFAESNAIFDASIFSWGVKRQYVSVRPISAVQFLYSGKKVWAWAGPGLGTQWIDGSTWQPYQPAKVVTPPFPEYLSGHSIFSAAASEILTRFTGRDYFGFSITIPAGSSAAEPGIAPATPITLSFHTYLEAANQAGISRRYGGIHFVPGDLDARALGHIVGTRDWTYARSFFEGHPGDVTDGAEDSIRYHDE